jgi:hypothetical protein
MRFTTRQLLAFVAVVAVAIAITLQQIEVVRLRARVAKLEPDYFPSIKWATGLPKLTYVTTVAEFPNILATQKVWNKTRFIVLDGESAIDSAWFRQQPTEFYDCDVISRESAAIGFSMSFTPWKDSERIQIGGGGQPTE